MSEVKKIQVDGVSYDLGGGSGLSDDAKNALLDCFNHVAWIDEDGQQYVDALQAALFDNTWSVTNTLTNATTSNPSAIVEKDGIYSATISASAGYTLEGATVSVTMNGADITSSVYDDGDILIPAVTGDVVITVVAVEAEMVSISAVYTQSGTVYADTPLDDLKADLVVTATYDDSSTVIVPSSDYTLSGTLALRTSTITVSVLDKTDTFNVSVTIADFTNGYTAVKQTSSVPYPQYVPFCNRQATSARATHYSPIQNKNYVFTVTDSAKYNIAIYDVESLSELSVPNISNADPKIAYSAGSKSISWQASDSASTPYIWIALKKMNNTAFTDAELANGAAAVFTYTAS